MHGVASNHEPAQRAGCTELPAPPLHHFDAVSHPAPQSDRTVPARADDRYREVQLSLFNASVLKQGKWRALDAAIGEAPVGRALDLGADNGVISWLLRQRGGTWSSADLTPETVKAIGTMVGEPVALLTGPSLPYADAEFDTIVVVDLLEHLHDDRALLSEIARCLRPGGRVIMSIPTAKPLGLLPPIRHAIGLTDAWHGHVHAGYDRRTLRELLPATLRLERLTTYSRFFSHLLDTALNWVYLRRSRGRARSTAKGMVVTADGIDGKSLAMLRRAYPVMRTFAALDALLPWTRGYMSVAQLVRAPSSNRS